MFFECQWLILFQAENICFLPPVALTQSTLKSVGIVLLTSKPFRSSPVPSVVYNFIVKYHRTGNICFKLFFLSFATLKKKKPSLKLRCCARYIAERVVPNRQQAAPRKWLRGSGTSTVSLFVLRQRLLRPGNTAAPLHAALIAELGTRAVASSLFVTACPQQISRPTPLQIQR